MVKEVWKDVQGYEGLYQVSNFGRIKSLARVVKWFARNHWCERFDCEKILSQEKNVTGYKTIKLFKDGKKKKLNVHRLVAVAFIPNPEKKETVNHKDGDRTNNNVSNLEWATYSENNQHAYDVLGKAGVWIGKPTPNSRKVLRVDTGVVFRSVRKAAESIGINQSSLYDALMRGVKCKNIEWRYV